MVATVEDDVLADDASCFVRCFVDWRFGVVYPGLVDILGVFLTFGIVEREVLNGGGGDGVCGCLNDQIFL